MPLLSLSRTLALLAALGASAFSHALQVEAENVGAMSGIQTETTTDFGGGLNVGWIDAGDWLSYSINLPTAGSYQFKARTAGLFNAQFQIKTGQTLVGQVNVNNSQGWQNWQDSGPITLQLPAGPQTLRLEALSGGFNINYFSLEAVTPLPPVGGLSLPGRIQAEDFSGFSDSTAGNAGGAYRNLDVDIETTTDTGGGFNVGWTAPNEWLHYDVSVDSTANYRFQFRVASGVVGTKTFKIKVDGVDKGTLSFNDAAGWQAWRTLSLDNIPLTNGQHSLQIAFVTGGINLNYWDAAISGGASSVSSASSAAPISSAPQVSSAPRFSSAAASSVAASCPVCQHGDANQLNRVVTISGRTYLVKNIWGNCNAGTTWAYEPAQCPNAPQPPASSSAVQSSSAASSSAGSASLAKFEPANGMYVAINSDVSLPSANFYQSLGFKPTNHTIYVSLNTEGFNWLRQAAKAHRDLSVGLLWVTFMPPRTYVVSDATLASISQILAEEEAKGSKFFVTIGHEMNLDNGDMLRPKAYKNMFRRFATGIKANTVNTAIMWIPNVAGTWWPGTFTRPPVGSEEWNELDVNKNGQLDGWEGYAAFYPGDDSVDWVGMDLYVGSNPTRTLESSLNFFFYQEYCVNRNKPMALMETAARWNSSQGDELTFKRNWYTQVFNVQGDNFNAVDVAARFPKLKYVGWFDRNKEFDYRLSSNPVVTSDWRNTLLTLRNGQKYFLDADDFKRLNP